MKWRKIEGDEVEDICQIKYAKQSERKAYGCQVDSSKVK